MPRQKTTTPEVSTEVIKAEAIALVQQSSITELEAAINTTILQSEELLRRSDLGRLEFTLGSLEVTNLQELDNARQYLVALKDGKTRYSAFWNSNINLKKVFHAVWQLLCRSQAAGEKRFDDAIEQVQSAMKPYLQELKREEEKRQQLLADAAEARRKKTESEARTRMLEGNMTAAAVLTQQAKSIQTPVLPTEPVVMAGLSTRPKKVVTVTEPQKLGNSIAAGTPIAVVKEWNITFLQEQAKQNITYPGTTVEDDISFSRRAS
jgi:hypothetical protein